MRERQRALLYFCRIVSCGSVLCDSVLGQAPHPFEIRKFRAREHITVRGMELECRRFGGVRQRPIVAKPKVTLDEHDNAMQHKD